MAQRPRRDLLDALADAHVQIADLRRETDKLYMLVAELALVNDELRARVKWYRDMYHMNVGDKVDSLLAEHRLNSVG